MHGAEEFRGYRDSSDLDPRRETHARPVSARDGRSLRLRLPRHNFSNHQQPQHQPKTLLESIKLVVVMSAVETWKVSQVRQRKQYSAGNSRWRIVGDRGKRKLERTARVCHANFPTDANSKSKPFADDVHRPVQGLAGGRRRNFSGTSDCWAIALLPSGILLRQGFTEEHP